MGLREGEALALRWVDVNSEANELRVRHTLQNLKGTFTLVEPKSARSRRVLTMPAVVADRLCAHWHTQQEDRRAAGDKWEDWNLVFSTRRGRPLDGCRVNRDFKRVLVRASSPEAAIPRPTPCLRDLPDRSGGVDAHRHGRAWA